nr:hypothetical protein GCM10020185_60130 [Pseudomonas brassicacearum subsp. brassicacearum]
MYDLYGPSEDTTYSTWTRRTAGGTANIGRPLKHTASYLLDADLQPVPQGVSAELYLSGAGITRGYLGRAAMTAEKNTCPTRSPQPANACTAPVT